MKVHILILKLYDENNQVEKGIRGVFKSEEAAEDYADENFFSDTTYNIKDFEVKNCD